MLYLFQWRMKEMDYESFEKKLIQQQNILIQQLEEQLDVYREKDKYQELLIENSMIHWIFLRRKFPD